MQFAYPAGVNSVHILIPGLRTNTTERGECQCVPSGEGSDSTASTFCVSETD
jgi:hypothetical protein